MKILFMTDGDEGTFDVFHTVIIPGETAAPGQIDRWTSIANASPIQPIIVTEKENLFIGSTYDPESDLFTLAENIPASAAKPLDQKNVVFLIDNIVVGTYGIHRTDTMLEAAFSSPITLMIVEDNSSVVQGYTWDGLNFKSPQQ